MTGGLFLATEDTEDTEEKNLSLCSLCSLWQNILSRETARLGNQKEVNQWQKYW